jgi:hypothetical protein
MDEQKVQQYMQEIEARERQMNAALPPQQTEATPFDVGEMMVTRHSALPNEHQGSDDCVKCEAFRRRKAQREAK